MSENMDKAGQSEARFIVKAFEKGWEIAKPFHHAQSYDFVIRRNGEWQTVQVKSAYKIKDIRSKKGVTYHKVIDLRRRKWKPYEKGDFDLLAVVWKECVWLIKWEELMSHTLMMMGPKYDKFII
jgi:radical SAM superfamily enzyme YgiQ (UPF0313 family)